MDIKNSKFNSLTPEVLTENKSIYTEALDYAFANKDIKNIAITGIYGAGKSTVWKTYTKEKSLKNIITVSLGKYEDNLSICNEENIKEEPINNDSCEKISSNLNSKSENNRIERQIINQILSQVETNKIPLSKYGFKKNKGYISILKNILPLLSFVLSIAIWALKDVLEPVLNSLSIEVTTILIVCLGLFLYPLIYWSYMFFKSNRLHVSKINVKGAEANFNELTNDDETILERDMKEIVYLLNCSDTQIVVFEDLDRYDNIEIFTKLRELNFLINSFISTQDKDKEIIKFVYMVRDGLFISKNRTKFFDFIIPIVPVVDSKNSENKLFDSIKTAINLPDKKIIAQISLYIDDMRLLKNIVNEYLIYENIIAIKDLSLDANKLLALIVLKNIFPREFDLLQEDKGYIYNIFEQSKDYKAKARKEISNRIDTINDELNILNNRHENSKFEAMAAMLSPNVRVYDNYNNISWPEFIKDKSAKPNDRFRVDFINSNNNYDWNYYNYESFVNTFILTTKERVNLINSLPENRESRIVELLHQKKKLEKQSREINLYSVKDLLNFMNDNEINKVFLTTESGITQDHYFPLIRFLVMQGLIDETYWHYKGCFYQGSLGKNDTIFLKNLLEAKEQDVFLEIENANEVKNRLNTNDFHRFNILNKNLLEFCINSRSKEELNATIDSVVENELYDMLMSILNEYQYELIKAFVGIIIEMNERNLIKILDREKNEVSIAYNNILMSICTNASIDFDVLRRFSPYIEKNEHIVSLIVEEEFATFINNISSAEIKFYDMAKVKTTVSRMMELEKIRAYKLNVKNIRYITENILGREVDYGNLLSEIYNSQLLVSTMEYLESNFVEFIEAYIDENTKNGLYRNNEYIIVEILNSKLSDEYKLKYIENNEEMVSDISKIAELKQNIIFINSLIERNKMLFNLGNINTYWESVDEFNKVFTDYFDWNINDDNYDEILSGNIEISNLFINSSLVSDKVFEYALKYADEQISNLDKNLDEEKVMKLIKVNMVSISNENLNTLLNNNFLHEMSILINKQSDKEQDAAIDIILSLVIPSELIYELVNSDISYENAVKLLNLIIDDVLIEKIDLKKESIIEYVIQQGLSDTNLNYISKNFTKFTLKNEFIDYLDANNKFSRVKIENFESTFIQMVFSKKNVSVDSKIDIIITMIKNNNDKEKLIKYISTIQEIVDLAEVWHNKRPALDNPYKEKVGEALIDNGYVSKRNDRDCVRIMERKKRFVKNVNNAL